MPIFYSEAARGIIAPPMPIVAGSPTEFRYAIQIPNTGLLAGDIFEVAPIPANMRVSQLICDTDDLDTGTALVMDIGIMSGQWGDLSQARTCGNEFFAAFTGGRTGGVFTPTAVGAYRTGKAPFARSIGVRITTLAAGAVAGILGLTVSCVD